MVAKDSSNGAWRDDTESAVLLFYHFFTLRVCQTKGWEAQKIQWFVVFVTELTFLIAYGKKLSYKLNLYFAFGTAFSNTNIFIIACAISNRFII